MRRDVFVFSYLYSFSVIEYVTSWSLRLITPRCSSLETQPTFEWSRLLLRRSVDDVLVNRNTTFSMIIHDTSSILRTFQLDLCFTSARFGFSETSIMTEVSRFYIFDVQGGMNHFTVGVLLLTKSCRLTWDVGVIDSTPIQWGVIGSCGWTA